MRECLMTSIMHLLELGNWTHLGAVLARVVHNWLDQRLAVTLGSPVVGVRPAVDFWGLLRPQNLGASQGALLKLVDSLPRLTGRHPLQ